MRKWLTFCGLLFAATSAVSAAEILVVVEQRGIERWQSGSPTWKRVGTFLDPAKCGFKPVSVTATADGRVYVACAESGKGSIEEFSAEGQHLRTLAKLNYRPFGIGVHPDGRRLVLAGNTKVLKSYDLATGAESDYITQAMYGSRLFRFGPDGNCWVSNPYDNLIAVFDDSTPPPLKKLGEVRVFECNGGFDFGGANLTHLLVPSLWYESVDLIAGTTDVAYPEDVPTHWCQSTVRVDGEVYAADFARGGIVHLPAKSGPVTLVANAPGMISGMVNLTEARDGSDRRRFAAAKAKLQARGRRLFTGEPKLPDGMWDLERMRFNNPGLEVDLSVGIWPHMRILKDGVTIGSSSVPRELVRHHRCQGHLKYDAGTETTWAQTPMPVNYNNPGVGDPQGPSPHFRATRGCQRHYVDMTGDGVVDCVDIYSDWSEYGVPGPACPLAYDASGKWTNNQIQAFAYLYKREGAGKDGKWLKPEPILCDGKQDLQKSFSIGGAIFGDYNGDGRMDMITGDFRSEIWYYENVGTADHPAFAAGRHPTDASGKVIEGALCMMYLQGYDYDGDGKVDLLATEEDGRASWFRNLGRYQNGVPLFAQQEFFRQEADELKFGCLATPVAVDWDGDGYLDIMANDVKGSVVFIRNPGKRGTTVMEAPQAVEVEWKGEQPRFAWEWRPPTGKALRAMWRTTPLMHDWNGDGLPDLIFQAKNAFVMKNLGTDAEGNTRFRDLRPLVRKRLAGHTCCPTVCDFNADGVPDLVLGAEDGHFYYFRNPRPPAKTGSPAKRKPSNKKRAYSK